MALREALAILRQPEKGTPQLGVMALALLQQAFGGTHPVAASSRALAPFEFRVDPASFPDVAAEVLTVVRPLFPSGNPLVDAELARTLAALGDNHPDTATRMLGAFGVQSPVASDIHYLACLARLNPGGPAPGLTNLAEVFLWLDNKIGDAGNMPGLNWKTRVTELATELIERHPDIGLALIGNRQLPAPEHAYLCESLGEPRIDFARERFMEAAEGLSVQRWNAETIDLLVRKPSEKLFTGLRVLWSRPELQSAIIQALARQPAAADREKFVAALESADRATLQSALDALTALPDNAPAQTIGAVIRVLQHALARPEFAGVRTSALAWLRKNGGLQLEVDESFSDRRSLELIYRPVLHWFATSHPAAALELSGMDVETYKFWDQAIRDAPFVTGKAQNGATLFKTHRCADCHAGGPGLGPQLSGLNERMSPAGMLRAVVFPHQDVPPGEELLRVTLRDGSLLSGAVVLQTPETLILHQSKGDTGQWETIRLPQSEVVHRRQTRESTMPVGLMKGTNARDLADLAAYLQTL